jgi:metal-responsive CopG/Arc/MetJ family transcriptional regulator
MKERVSFTFDKKTVGLINRLLENDQYRNRSHLVEKAILAYCRHELGDEYE